MSAPNDGGPAFPIAGLIGPDNSFTEMPVPGMSLRDYFAGQAIAGNLIEPSVDSRHAAEYAYQLADAMLAERAKEAD